MVLGSRRFMFFWAYCSVTFNMKLPSQNPTWLLQLFLSCSHSSHWEREKGEEEGMFLPFENMTRSCTCYLSFDSRGRMQCMASSSCKEGRQIQSWVACAQIQILLLWKEERTNTRCNQQPSQTIHCHSSLSLTVGTGLYAPRDRWGGLTPSSWGWLPHMGGNGRA